MSDDITNEAATEKDPVAEALASARQSFPNKKLWAANSAAGVLILTVPPKAQCDYYLACLYSDEPAEKAKAMQALLLGCALIPDTRTLKGMIETEYPLLSRDPEVVRACSLAAGMAKENAAKK